MSNIRQVQQSELRESSKVQFDFSKGMISNLGPEIAPGSGVRFMKNFELHSNFPRPTKINGYTSFDGEIDSANTENLIFNLFFIRDTVNGKGRLIAFRDDSNDANARIYATPLDSISWSNIQDGVDNSSYYQAATWLFQNSSGNDVPYLYVCNGTDFYKIDGQNSYSAGNSAPSSAPSASAGSAGNIDGTTKIGVTFDYGEFGESSLGPTTEVTVSDEEIDLSSIPTGGSLVEGRNIWRTDERTYRGQAEEIFFLAKEINDNSTTSTTLTDDGEILVAAKQLPDDNASIPTPSVIASYANRMWYAGGNIENGRIYYSKELKPDVTKKPGNTASNNAIDSVGARDGNDVVAMAGAERQLFILTNKSVWVLRGRGFQNWQLNRAHNIGTYSPRTVKVINGRCYFLGSDFEHIYRTDGRNLESVSSGNESYIRGIDPNWAKRFYAIHNPLSGEYKIGVHRPGGASGGPQSGGGVGGDG